MLRGSPGRRGGASRVVRSRSRPRGGADRVVRSRSRPRGGADRVVRSRSGIGGVRASERMATHRGTAGLRQRSTATTAAHQQRCCAVVGMLHNGTGCGNSPIEAPRHGRRSARRVVAADGRRRDRAPIGLPCSACGYRRSRRDLDAALPLHGAGDRRARLDRGAARLLRSARSRSSRLDQRVARLRHSAPGRSARQARSRGSGTARPAAAPVRRGRAAPWSGPTRRASPARPAPARKRVPRPIPRPCARGAP